MPTEAIRRRRGIPWGRGTKEVALRIENNAGALTNNERKVIAKKVLKG